MLEALRLDGQPHEAFWPYLSQTPTDASWSPPSPSGEIFKRVGAGVAPSWSAVISLLDQGRPAILLLMLSHSFYDPGAKGVVKPANDEVADPSLRHAILAVGHGVVDGQGALLVRNSWGDAWGDGGHAWLPANFVTPRLYGMALFEEDDDVSPCSDAA